MTTQSNREAQGGNFFGRVLRSIGNLFRHRRAVAEPAAAGEFGRIYSSAYGARDNDPPGNGVLTRGQNGNFTATLADGSYGHPTSLAVRREWLDRGDEKGYFREGDLVHIGGRGWFRAEDWCGACDRLRRIDQWTGDTNGQQQARLTRMVEFHVFHPNESIPSALRMDSRPAGMDY